MESPNQIDQTVILDHNPINDLPKIISCEVCGTTFHAKKEADDHFTKQHPGTLISYTCMICYQTFCKYSSFRGHLYKHDQTRVRCDKCNKLLTEQTYQSHKNINCTAYECKKCFNKYASLIELSYHLIKCSIDSQEKNIRCDISSVDSKFKGSLVEHHKLRDKIKPAMLKNSTYRCKYCSDSYKSPAKLNMHLKDHIENKPFHCDYCETSFTNNLSRIEHIKKMHSNLCCHQQLEFLEKNACVLTGDGSTIFESMLKITGSPQYVCSVCPTSLSCRRSWLRHMKRWHLKNEYKYKCEYCNKVLIFPKALEICTELLDNFEKSFICDYCGNKYSEKCNLFRHIVRAGHIESNQECPTCNKRFVSLGHLKAHRKVHQKPKKDVKSKTHMSKREETPKLYNCLCCEKWFKHNKSRLRHMRNEHINLYLKDFQSDESQKNYSQVIETLQEKSCELGSNSGVNDNLKTTLKNNANDHLSVPIMANLPKVLPNITQMTVIQPSAQILNLLVPEENIYFPQKDDHDIVQMSSQDLKLNSDATKKDVDWNFLQKSREEKLKEMEADILNYLNTYYIKNTEFNHTNLHTSREDKLNNMESDILKYLNTYYSESTEMYLLNKLGDTPRCEENSKNIITNDYLFTTQAKSQEEIKLQSENKTIYPCKEDDTVYAPCADHFFTSKNEVQVGEYTTYVQNSLDAHSKLDAGSFTLGTESFCLTMNDLSSSWERNIEIETVKMCENGKNEVNNKNSENIMSSVTNFDDYKTNYH